jgi:hypothetical protein
MRSKKKKNTAPHLHLLFHFVYQPYFKQMKLPFQRSSNPYPKMKTKDEIVFNQLAQRVHAKPSPNCQQWNLRCPYLQ